jgi:hypothetical protein
MLTSCMHREFGFSYNASAEGGATVYAMQGQIPCAECHRGRGDYSSKGGHRRHGNLQFSVFYGSVFIFSVSFFWFSGSFPLYILYSVNGTWCSITKKNLMCGTFIVYQTIRQCGWWSEIEGGLHHAIHPKRGIWGWFSGQFELSRGMAMTLEELFCY